MAQRVTKEEVEAQLRGKAAEIEQRLGKLQEEVSTVGSSVGKAVVRHPLVSVGGALLAGLAVGLLFGGGRRSKGASGGGLSQQVLAERFMQAVIAEASARVADGEETGEAVRQALERRVPLVVQDTPDQEEGGFLRQTGRILVRSVISLGIHSGLDYLMAFLVPQAMRPSASPAETPAPTPAGTPPVSDPVEV